MIEVSKATKRLQLYLQSTQDIRCILFQFFDFLHHELDTSQQRRDLVKDKILKIHNKLNIKEMGAKAQWVKL